MQSSCPYEVDMKKYEDEAAKAEEEAQLYNEKTVKKLRAEMDEKLQKRRKMEDEEKRKLKEQLE